MKSNLIVSVIIPVFNVRPYLCEALDSVINQSYQNLDIIIIDDGSTDGSAEICDEYAKKDTRIIVLHQDNRGLSTARNVGLELMSGEAVVFMDSDDAYRPQYVEKMIKSMTDTQVDIVICKASVHETLGKMDNCNAEQHAYPTAPEGQYDRIESLRLLAVGAINQGVWNKLYKSKLWKGIRFPDGRVYEDVDTTFRIIDLCKRTCVISDTLYMRRFRQGSITDTCSKENISDMLLAHSHFDHYIFDNSPEIFSDELIRKREQSKIDTMIGPYVRFVFLDYSRKKICSELKKEIISTGQSFGVKSLGFSKRLSYYSICYCPWLLRIAYPLYHRIRNIKRKNRERFLHALRRAN